MAVEKPTNSVNREVRQVHLPRYELEKFDGDVTRFREFWDQFEVSVHQQVDLSNATKLVYLRGCLTGVALDALQGLSAANQGYEIAVQRLKERCNRPHSSDVPDICEVCHNGVLSLSALGKNPRDGSLSMGEVLIAVARERLPPSIRVQWDKQAMEDDSLAANLPVFLRFLQDQVELDDTVRGTKKLRLESKRSTRAMGKLGNSVKGTETQRTMAFLHSAVELSCALCHEQHTIAECMKFRQASHQRNKEIAARFQICFSCFKPGHISIGCKSRRRRSGPSSKDSSSVTPVDTATAERVQETPTGECKSSDVSMLQANLDSRKQGRNNRFQMIKAKAYGGAESGLTVTCLLDTGAEETQPVVVEGFGGAAHEHPRSQMVRLWLGRLDGNRSAELFPLEALTVPSPTFDDESSDEVHVVIGIDYYHRFLGDAIRRGKPGDPVAVETVLGWIICGPVNPRPVPKSVATFSAT
ncbi:hypothetical protein T4D_10967, partial [Trichinella pseudospiralis]